MGDRWKEINSKKRQVYDSTPHAFTNVHYILGCSHDSEKDMLKSLIEKSREYARYNFKTIILFIFKIYMNITGDDT